jgi:hypothetical protein
MLLTYIGRQSEAQAGKIMQNQQQLCEAIEYTCEEIKNI